MDEEKQIQVTDEQIRETEHFWDDPQKIMNLIDIMFLSEDPDRREICS